MVNVYKVVLCGKTGVGKTSIFKRMCGSDMDCSQKPRVKTTNAHECYITVQVQGETAELNLWDTLGLEQHAQLTRSHFLLSQAVLIVYSVTDEDSLSQAIDLLKYAKIEAEGACFILVRNKIDLEPTFPEDKLMALIPGNAFVLQFRTSALTGDGIQDMLEQTALHLLKKATPMKSIGRYSCLQKCDGNSASYNEDEGIVRLQIEDLTQPPRRKNCSSCSS